MQKFSLSFFTVHLVSCNLMKAIKKIINTTMVNDYNIYIYVCDDNKFENFENADAKLLEQL